MAPSSRKRTTCGRMATAGFLAATWLLAPMAGAVAAPASAEDPTSIGGLLKLTLALLVVLAAIGASAWLFKRLGRIQSGFSGALRILGGLSLGTRERVVLVQVGEQQLLLGVAPGRVQTLHVLERPVTEATAPAGGPVPPFAVRLAGAMRRVSGKG